MKTDEYSHVDFDKVTESQLAAFADRIAVIKVNEDVEAGGIPTALHFLICWEYKGWKNCGFSTDGRQTKITTVCGLS